MRTPEVLQDDATAADRGERKEDVVRRHDLCAVEVRHGLVEVAYLEDRRGGENGQDEVRHGRPKHRLATASGELRQKFGRGAGAQDRDRAE